jgi:hypothetical protein
MVHVMMMQVLYSNTINTTCKTIGKHESNKFSRGNQERVSKKERTVHSHFMSCFLASLMIVSIMASRGGLSANYRERLLIARLRATAAWHPCARNF